MVLCIFAEQEDIMPTYVAQLAERRGIKPLWLSESKLGETWFYSFADGDEGENYIEYEESRYDFADLSGAYVNMNPQPGLPFDIELEVDDLDAFMGARRSGIRHLIDMLPFPVANRLNAGRSNNSKPYQMCEMTRFGFRVPIWITSNDLEAIRAFVEQCNGEIICKSISGLRSRVRKLDDLMSTRLQAGTTPIIVQQYIGGRDVRVHTINGHAFPTEIRTSETLDYRFDKGEREYSAISMPAEIEKLCHQFAAKEGLIIAGFDFRVDEDDQWFCLEMNPVPTFLPYELETGQPIGNTLLDVIACPSIY